MRIGARLGSRRPHCCGTWKRKWASDGWALGSRQGGLGAGVASMGIQVPVEADIPLPSGSLGAIWVCGFRLEKHLLGCKLPVATGCFPLLQPGQAWYSRTSAL